MKNIVIESRETSMRKIVIKPKGDEFKTKKNEIDISRIRSFVPKIPLFILRNNRLVGHIVYEEKTNKWYGLFVRNERYGFLVTGKHIFQPDFAIDVGEKLKICCQLLIDKGYTLVTGEISIA